MRIVRPVFIVAPPASGADLLFQLLSTAPALSPVRTVTDLDDDALYRRLHHHQQRLLVLDDGNARRLVQLAERFPMRSFFGAQSGNATIYDFPGFKALNKT